MINKQSLQARIDTLSKDKDINPTDALRFYFFDEFLKRLSQSPYRNNFVFKGGFYLSSFLGISSRATLDIDFLVTQADFTKTNLIQIVKTISQINIEDGIVFSFSSISPIREEDDYGGYNIVLLGRLDNIRQPVSIDIVTGDPVTPEPIHYSYQTLLGNEKISCLAYNLETLLSEKLQTILEKGELNSRCKDFYDVYILWEREKADIRPATLKRAFEKTCSYRKTLFSKQEIDQTLARISSSGDFRKRWTAYTQKRGYTKGLPLSSCLSAVKSFVSFLF